MRTALTLIVVLALPASKAWACAACQDSDVFKNAFVSSTNASAEAAAATTAAPVTTPQTAAAPRERQILNETSPTGTNEAPVKRPALHIRSFNELK